MEKLRGVGAGTASGSEEFCLKKKGVNTELDDETNIAIYLNPVKMYYLFPFTPTSEIVQHVVQYSARCTDSIA